MDCLRSLRGRHANDADGGRPSGPLSFGFAPGSWSSDAPSCGKATRRDEGVALKSTAHRAILDAITLQPRHLYELFGEASAGKTQLCLQLVVRAVLGRVDGRPYAASLRDGVHVSRGSPTGRAVYLFTEGGTMKMDRLRQIASTRLGDEALADDVMRHVHVEYASSVDELIAKLLMLEEVLRETNHHGRGDEDCDPAGWMPPVKLFVLDSIAHVFRFREEDRQETSDTGCGRRRTGYDTSRTQAFFKIASILKRYADEYDLVVLVTNQVVDAFEDGDGAACVQDRPGCAGLKLETSGRAVYPSLGLAWSSCVTTRLFVTKETAMCDERRAMRPVVVDGHSFGKQLRGLQVVFSPESRPVKTHFVIESSGCVGVDVGIARLGLGD